MVLPGHAGEMPLRAHGILPRAQRLRCFAPDPLHLRFQHFRRDGCDDAVGYFVLNGENVREFAIVPPSPDMSAMVRLDELGGDANAVGHPANAAFEDIADAEFSPDPAHIDGLTL